MREAGHTLSTMPFLFFFPALPFVLNLILLALFGAASLLVLSLRSESSFSGVDSVQQGEYADAVLVFYGFGFIWCSEIVKAIAVMTVAGAVGSDYWIPKNAASSHVPALPTWPALHRAIRYHMGSAIFGGFILAAIRVARYIMMYIDQKAAELKQQSIVAVVIFQILHCALMCFEKCMRFLSYNAYILIAVEGGGFCQTAWKGFKLIFTNSMRVAVVQVLTSTVISLANFGIVGACTAMAYMSVSTMSEYGVEGDSYIEYQLIPVGLVACLAWVVSGSFMAIYDTAVATLLLSFCLDESNMKHGKYENKTDLVTGKPDKRMYCVVNEKIGLIKVSPSRHCNATSRPQYACHRLNDNACGVQLVSKSAQEESKSKSQSSKARAGH
jgi:hypothetical protein